MASDQTLAEFRMRVAMLRRQRWRQIEYSEDPPVALLFADADVQERAGGRRFSARAGARQPTWRKVWVNESGRVMQENVPPPDEAEADAPAASAEAAEAPAEKPAKAKAEPAADAPPAKAPAKPRVLKKAEPLPPVEDPPAPARRRKAPGTSDTP